MLFLLLNRKCADKIFVLMSGKSNRNKLRLFLGKQFVYGVYAFLVVTPKKTCGFGATPGFGGDTPLFFGFGGDFFSALMVLTKNHPHVVVTSTNRATFGGDKALSAQTALPQRR